MAFIVAGSGIVAADHAGNAADAAVDDVVIQGVISAAEGAAQVILNGFHAKAGDLGGFVPGNHDFGPAVLEVVDGHR